VLYEAAVQIINSKKADKWEPAYWIAELNLNSNLATLKII
jgi:hypothetical protein